MTMFIRMFPSMLKSRHAELEAPSCLVAFKKMFKVVVQIKVTVRDT